ncbi:hypothetical protein EN871_17650 [bacterium M00.F.Ca.ET.228.01.1.1]|uniref:Uncharacterized protein n=1 Tax=Burkholderia sp. (strain CCGE1003) TaxID=640512 RepID=E1T6N1_BURSG|nr:hypothetical protein [Paraburkholderia phenoliruptrix]TGP42759.1 hypothetical protein EN871_17650 [bacterium M00.F.Ca.ET.228.01.1.1]TGR98950.1 hypothetical protein EN834_20290 [bacterium M00.F.Ca.ET.191.01.1.1]TGU03264.1 hypothetical protein EN798_21110 [bacterium M00.F.Ca.ET.155.01.1.1]MBW0447329.1 hypothetical protein [Paraburkholderia phenoliruptrix]MBW9098991.1 hypothetical protein [Paraburkholderia phenoliruptrix]
MERLARLLPFRQFGRLRHLRKLVPCSLIEASSATTASLFDSPASGSGVHAALSSSLSSSLPSSLPAFARVSLNSGLNMAEPARRAPVRVYHGPSRLIMVGTVDAVCRMIDRCIAEETNVQGAVFEA